MGWSSSFTLLTSRPLHSPLNSFPLSFPLLPYFYSLFLFLFLSIYSFSLFFTHTHTYTYGLSLSLSHTLFDNEIQKSVLYFFLFHFFDWHWSLHCFFLTQIFSLICLLLDFSHRDPLERNKTSSFLPWWSFIIPSPPPPPHVFWPLSLIIPGY